MTQNSDLVICSPCPTGAQQQRKRKREPESQRQQVAWKGEQAAAHVQPAGLGAPLQDAESQHAAAHGYSMLNHSAAAAAAGRREHAAGRLLLCSLSCMYAQARQASPHLSPCCLRQAHLCLHITVSEQQSGLRTKQQ